MIVKKGIVDVDALRESSAWRRKSVELKGCETSEIREGKKKKRVINYKTNGTEGM